MDTALYLPGYVGLSFRRSLAGDQVARELRMSYTTTMSSMTLLLLLTGFPTTSSASVSMDVDWYETDEAVRKEIYSGASLGALCRAEVERDRVEPSQVVRRINLFSRAGWEDALKREIERLPGVEQAPAPKAERSPTITIRMGFHNRIATIIGVLFDRGQWDAARRLVELFPKARPRDRSDLVGVLADQMKPGDLDAWLADRSTAGGWHWHVARLRWRKRRGTVGELIKEHADAVRKAPADLEAASRYADAADVIADSRGDLRRRLAWLADSCRPATSFDAFRLGRRLGRTAPRVGVAMLKRSLTMPFTPEDAKAAEEDVRNRVCLSLREDRSRDWEVALRYWTHDELTQLLLSSGRAGEAQKHLETARKLAKKNRTIPDYRLAGNTQWASGARVVEGEILAAEPERKYSYRYWISRARYYEGRKEAEQADSAYRRAVGEAARVKKPDWVHWDALSDYISFLVRSKRKDEAAALQRAEVLKHDLAGSRAGYLMTRYASMARWVKDPDLKLMWRYLHAREAWGSHESSVIVCLVECDALEEAYDRLVKLADAHPSRAVLVGERLVYDNRQPQALPVLRKGFDRATAPERKRRMASMLFRAYWELRNWKAALEFWPEQRAGLTAGEVSDRLRWMARETAEAGKKDLALSLWKQAANYDRYELGHLEAVAKAGLGPALLKHYRTLEAAEPESVPVKTAIAVLQQDE